MGTEQSYLLILTILRFFVASVRYPIKLTYTKKGLLGLETGMHSHDTEARVSSNVIFISQLFASAWLSSIGNCLHQQPR